MRRKRQELPYGSKIAKTLSKLGIWMRMNHSFDPPTHLEFDETLKNFHSRPQESDGAFFEMNTWKTFWGVCHDKWIPGRPCGAFAMIIVRKPLTNELTKSWPRLAMTAAIKTIEPIATAMMVTKVANFSISIWKKILFNAKKWNQIFKLAKWFFDFPVVRWFLRCRRSPSNPQCEWRRLKNCLREIILVLLSIFAYQISLFLYYNSYYTTVSSLA